MVEEAKKKRVAERQLTKDDRVEDDDDENDDQGADRDPNNERAFNPNLKAGVFARASEEEMKKRRVVRAKRRGAVVPGSTIFAKAQEASKASAQSASEEPNQTKPGAGAGGAGGAGGGGASNPFAGISFAQPGPAGSSKKVNPFAGVSFATSAGGFGGFASAAAKKPEPVDEKGNAEGVSKAKDQEKEKEDGEQAEKKPASPFGGGGFTFGKGTGGGFGAFGGGAGFGGFGSSAKTQGEAKPEGATQAVGGSAEPKAEAVAIGSEKAQASAKFQEKEVVTGEESERSVFESTGALYEFSDNAWREKGKGSVTLNLNEETNRARLVMRQKGSKRLVLNANLWPGMAITRMKGSNGVTFAAVNHLGGEGKGDEKGDGGEGGTAGGKASSFALRLPKTEKIERFQDLLEKHKKQDQEA